MHRGKPQCAGKVSHDGVLLEILGSLLGFQGAYRASGMYARFTRLVPAGSAHG